MKPEEFCVTSDRDGGIYLSCPGCGWEREVGGSPWPHRPPPIADDLTSLRAAAVEHIEDRHQDVVS